MEKWLILAAVIVVVIAAIAISVRYRMKKKSSEVDRNGSKSDIKNASFTKINQSKETVEDNAKQCEGLAELYAKEISEETAEELKKMTVTLRYLSPSDNEEVNKCDKKISDKLGDLKIALTKNKVNEEDVKDVIEGIKALLNERNREV